MEVNQNLRSVMELSLYRPQFEQFSIIAEQKGRTPVEQIGTSIGFRFFLEDVRDGRRPTIWPDGVAQKLFSLHMLDVELNLEEMNNSDDYIDAHITASTKLVEKTERRAIAEHFNSTQEYVFACLSLEILFNALRHKEN